MIAYDEFSSDPEIFTIYLLQGEEKAREKTIEKRWNSFENYKDRDFVEYTKNNRELNELLTNLIETGKIFDARVIDEEIFPIYNRKVTSIKSTIEKELQKVSTYISDFEKEKALKQRNQIIDYFIRDYNEKYSNDRSTFRKISYIATLITLSYMLRTDSIVQLEDEDKRKEIEGNLDELLLKLGEEDKNTINNYITKGDIKEETVEIIYKLAVKLFNYSMISELNEGEESHLLEEVEEYEKKASNEITENNDLDLFSE